MKQGRELIRKMLETSIAQQVQAVKKKGRRAGRVRAE